MTDTRNLFIELQGTALRLPNDLSDEVPAIRSELERRSEMPPRRQMKPGQRPANA